MRLKHFLSVFLTLLTLSIGQMWGANLQLTLSLTSNPGSWPTTDGHSTTSANATISGTSYSFGFTSSVYFNSSYLMMKSGHALGLPAISGYKLITVVGTLNSAGNPSTASQVAIKTASSSGSVVTGGTAQTWNTKGGSKTYNLSGTAANTRYWMVVSNKNCQMTNLVLTYEPVSSCTNPSTLLSISSSNTATLGTDKTLTTSGGNNGTVTWTVANGTGSATVSGNTLHPTSAGTVTVTATQDDNDGKCGKVVNQTITVSKASATITMSELGATSSVSGTHYGGDSYTLPTTTTATCTGKKLVGWSTVEIEETDDKPTSNFYAKGESVTLAAGSNTFYAVFASGNGGKVTITPSSCTKTSTGYTLTDWSETSTNNETISGKFYIYSRSTDAALQFNGSNTPPFYNTTEFSAPITQIKITKASGSDRNWTPRLSATNQQTSSSATNGTSLTAKSVTESGAVWDIDASNDYRWLYLGLVTNASYVSSIEITYGAYSKYSTSCCNELASINGSISWTNPTEAVVTWDKLDDQVSAWALSWSPNTTGSSITSAIEDEGETQKTATVSGLACGTEYTFTFTPTIKSGVCAVETAPTIVETSPKYQITMTGSGTVDNGTFTVNGETAAKVYSCNGTNNVNIVATPATGYELDAWNITKDASSAAISPAAATASTTFSMPAEAVTVGVSFKAKKYAITYKDEGNNDYSGSNLASLPNEHTYNVATALVDGVRDGYSFVGWFTDEDCTVSAGSSIAANSITAATTLYAKWAEAGTKRVTISTPSHGSISVTYTGMESALTSGYRDIDDDTELTITATPADGYQLSSLKVGDDDEFTSGNKHTLTAAITISATFSAIEYGITYHLDGGTNHKDNPAKFTIESSAITLGTPTKTGYTFGGWYVNEDLAVGHEASTPAISAASTGAKAFWAKWTANESTITWDANEGSVEPTSSKYTYDGSTVALPTPTRDHYVFDGWFTEVSGGSEITEIGTTNKPEADVTYHAHWHKENYTVTWEVGGSTYTTGVSEANNNADYNNTVTAPTKPNDNSLNACQANGKFMGWSETKILSNDPVNGSSNISALGLFTTTSPAITKNTTFYAVFANGEISHKSAKFDASNTTATPATSNTNEWKHSASNILLKLSSGQRYTKGTPNTFTVYKGNGNYAQVTTATGQTVTSIDVECSSDDYKVRSVSSGASIGSAITSGTYPVYPITGTFANPFQLKENNTEQIRIVSITINYDTTAYTDYITECAPLTCSAPQSLASEPGKNGATISWSAQEVGTAAKYQYAVWADGEDEPTSGYSETTELTAEVSDLMSNTDYNWKVRTVCTGEDGESEFAKSTFTTGSVALTFSVPAGVSAVAASTSASALPSADVPSSCADCWVFAGWSSTANATSVEYAAGGIYKFNEDKTLYAVYGRPSNTYKLIRNSTELTVNVNYIITAMPDETEYALTSEGHASYDEDAKSLDITAKVEEVGDDYFISNPEANYIWKFTGNASAGKLFNAEASKYIQLSQYSSKSILDATGEDLVFTPGDYATWTIKNGDKYLRCYSSGFDAYSSGSVYLYKQQVGSLTTAPDCSGHSVTWHIIDDTQVDENVSACDGIETLPSVDVEDVRCKTTGTTFMGWSETNIGYTPTSDADEIAALNLFTDVAHAPAITEDKDFYAVFAQGTPATVTPQTVTYTITAKNELTPTGTAPTGSSATIAETFSTSKQMTGGNSQTLTLTNFGAWKITRIVLSMKSNQGSGAGTLTYSVDGGTKYSTLASGGFDTDAWNGSFATNYTDVTKNVNITTAADKDVVIKIQATANSIYCESYSITYEPIVTYDEYFTECCPQKDITLNGVVENEKVFSAKIAGEVVTKACEGETITLDYSENGHYTFNANSWLVYKTGDKNTTVTVTNNQFDMPAYPVTVEASWTPKNYKITIADADNGSATVKESSAYSQDDDGKWIVPYGSKVTLVATPSDPGHYFSSWTLSPENPSAAIDQAEMEITMPGDFTATPVFGEVTQSALSLVNTNTDKYTLTAKWGSTDTEIDEPEMGSIYSGTSIKVTYALVGQQEFVSWNMNNGAFTSFSTNGDTATFNMPEEDLTVDLNVRAYYTLGLDVNDEEQGSISSVRIKINDNYKSQDVEDSYNVHAGEKVEVVATPNENFKFVGWEKTGATAAYDGSSNTATLTVGTENITLRAIFAARETKTLTPMICGKAQDPINALEGTSVYSLIKDLNAAPALTGYTFEGWSATEDGAAISQSADVTLDDNMHVYAVYKKEAYYQKVTATSGITDGQYLIVYEDGRVAFNGGLSTLDATNNHIGVTISNNKIVSNNTMDAASFTIASIPNSDDYSVKSAGNLYIGQTGNSNGLSTNANSAYANTITFTNGVPNLVSGGAYLRFNSASNQMRFRYYQSSSYSGQKAIQLYKKVVPEDNESNPSTVVANGEEFEVDAATTLNNLTVEAGGKVDNASNKLTVNNLYIKSEASKSGQVANASAAKLQADAIYMDVTFFKGDNATTLDETTAARWYMISAPFDVNLSDGFTLTDGTPMHFGVDDNALTFDLFEYDGKKRGETGVTGWKRVQGKMKAGTACLIGFNPGQPTTIRLKAASTTLTEKTSITLQAFDGDATNQNWNGVANPTLHYTDLNKDVQTYNNEDGENGRKYIAYSASNTSFVVGTAFFVQETGTISLSAATHGSLRAPKRESERYEACVQIFRQEATDFADQMYVRASQTASNEYEQGHDMITWNGTTANTAMIWAENYGKRLAIEEAPLVSNQASYALGIFAPKAGTYRIAATSEDDADLYLTYEGNIIWNLSMGAYELELTKGTTEGYGLLLQAKAPGAATGVDNIDASEAAQKVIINDHVYILRNGQMYGVDGKAVK